MGLGITVRCRELGKPLGLGASFQMVCMIVPYLAYRSHSKFRPPSFLMVCITNKMTFDWLCMFSSIRGGSKFRMVS